MKSIKKDYACIFVLSLLLLSLSSQLLINDVNAQQRVFSATKGNS